MDGTLVEFIWKEETEVFRKQTRSVSGVWRGGSNSPETPKALQNRAILIPIVKTVKNC